MLWPSQTQNLMIPLLKVNLKFLGIPQYSFPVSGGGIMVFVLEDITATFLSFENKPVEALLLN